MESSNLHKVLFIVPQYKGDPAQNPGGQITAANGLIKYFEGLGIEIRVVNTVEKRYPPSGLFRKAFKSVLRVFVVFSLLCTRKYGEAILFSGGGLSLIERVFLCLLMRFFGVRSILFFRNSEVLRVNKRSLKGLTLRFVLKAPNRIAVQGQSWKKYFITLGVTKTKVIVIRNWVPPTIRIAEEPKDTPEDGPVHFVFVGLLVEAKGVYEIAEAINQLIRNNVTFKFTFVGNGTLEPWLRDQHAKLRWGESVVIAGWKSAQEIDHILNYNHVFVLPTYHEGFPNALLEAFAKGLPAISTNAGAISESLFDGENGFIVNAQDSVSLYTAMYKYINNPYLITKQSRKALLTTKIQHDWDLNCKAVADNLFGVL